MLMGIQLLHALALCCFARIGAVFAQFKCIDEQAKVAFEVPDNNVLVKLYKRGDLPLGNNENEVMMKQLLCDLIEHDIVIGAALDDADQAQANDDLGKLNVNKLNDGFKSLTISKANKKGENELSKLKTSENFSPSIRLAFKREFEILQTINERDKPLANLLHKMYKSISALKESINGDPTQQHQNVQILKSEIVDTVVHLARRWHISIIMPPSQNGHHHQISQNNLFEELAKLWHLYKSEKGPRGQKSDDDDKRDNDHQQQQQRDKRMLQLLMDFTADGADGMANLKGVKKSNKRNRRRRKRGDNSGKTFAILLFVFLLLAFAIYSAFHFHKKYKENQKQFSGGNDIESGGHQRAFEPEPRESPLPNRRKKHRQRSRSNSSESSRRGSRDPMYRSNLSSSRGDPDRRHNNELGDNYPSSSEAEEQGPRPSSVYYGDAETEQRKPRRGRKKDRRNRNRDQHAQAEPQQQQQQQHQTEESINMPQHYMYTDEFGTVQHVYGGYANWK